MYLSRLTIDRTNPGARQSLRDCQDMHRTIMQAFPDTASKNTREDLNVLYRLYAGEKAISLYVLSDIRPDWERIRSFGFLPGGCKDISRLPDAFEPGRNFAFDIMLQPSKKVGRADGNSQRVMLKSQEERNLWLERKAEENGFEMIWFREEGQNKLFGKHKSGNGGPVYLSAIRYTGVLSVTNKDRFENAYRKGIGPGKAYGLGMLMLKNT